MKIVKILSHGMRAVSGLNIRDGTNTKKVLLHFKTMEHLFGIKISG
jgi:hypothetical protein